MISFLSFYYEKAWGTEGIDFHILIEIFWWVGKRLPLKIASEVEAVFSLHLDQGTERRGARRRNIWKMLLMWLVLCPDHFTELCTYSLLSWVLAAHHSHLPLSSGYYSQVSWNCFTKIIVPSSQEADHRRITTLSLLKLNSSWDYVLAYLLPLPTLFFLAPCFQRVFINKLHTSESLSQVLLTGSPAQENLQLSPLSWFIKRFNYERTALIKREQLYVLLTVFILVFDDIQVTQLGY